MMSGTQNRAAGPVSPVPASAVVRARVLLVEQDAAVRRLWQTVLEHDGHDVVGTSLYGQLLTGSLFENKCFDLVIAESAALGSPAEVDALRHFLVPSGKLLLTGNFPRNWVRSDEEAVQVWAKPFPLEDLRTLAREAAQTSASNAPVAVICDDCPHTRDLLATVAGGLGYETICTEDGREVPEIVQACQARVVLLDILMPHQDGLVTLRQIRAARLPVDVITMSGGPSLYLHVAGQLGASHILTKPVPVETLRNLLLQIAARPSGWPDATKLSSEDL